MDIRISLPEAYPLQREIIDSPAKRKVICAGRRAGKTVLASLIGVERFIEGRKILLTSTTQEQADTFWQYAKDWLEPLWGVGAVYKNETRRIIDGTRVGMGIIRVKTAWEPNNFRGGDADLIVFDECALLDPAVWFAVAAPMLADRDGDAVFISSPQRRNWFYNLYRNAYDDAEGRWAAWHFTSHTNPYLSEVALANLVIDMTADMYRQEILAEFLEGEGQVFRKIRENATLQPAEPYSCDCVFGVDWAQMQDYTTIVGIDVRRREMLFFDRFRGVDWALQRGRIHAHYDLWKPALIMVEANSIGAPNMEALQREGLPVQGFMTTAKTKPPLIESLVLAFERDDIKIINDEILMGELEAYERVVSHLTGHSQYSAPTGMHDDLVMGLALAWHATHNRAATMQIVKNSWEFGGYRGSNYE